MPPRPFKLALAQMRVEPEAQDQNLARAEVCIAEAANAGAHVVLLPEALDFGWTDPSAGAGAGAIRDGKSCAALSRAARRHSVHLCAGIIERAGSELYNSAMLLDDSGTLLLHHRKINELAIAHSLYGQGDRLQVAETRFGRFGVMICADAFIAGQTIARALAMMGAQVILSPCAWAVPRGHDNAREPYGQLWLDHYGAVARSFGIWIAGASNVGPIRNGPWAGRSCIGCSLVVAPSGEMVAQAPYGEDAENILYMEVSPTEIGRPPGEPGAGL